VHDFLKSIFALSFLDDQDFNDYLQSNSYIDNESEGSHLGKHNYSGQSETLRKIREILLKKIETNGFLYKLFTQPQLVLTQQESATFKEYKLEFAPNEQYYQGLTQFITVEGTYTGFLYMTKEYLMF